MIAPHRTGNASTADDHPLRRFAVDVLTREIFGTTKFAHEQMTRWLLPEGRH